MYPRLPPGDNLTSFARRFRSMKSKLLLLVTTALVFAVAVAAQNPPAEPSLQGEGTLKVMTYNMYAGTEYAGLTDPNYANFLQAVSNLILDVRASDPTGRAAVIAHQIAATKPHLVSLQEAATWATGPAPNNLTVEFDFLQLLLDALAAQGLQYTTVGSLTHFDVTLPASIGYLRNTWRVVVLARADLKPEDFSFTNVQAAPWTPPCTWVVPVPALNSDCQSPRTPGTPACMLPFPRGWVSTDVSYRGKQLRYIGAHLDSRSASKNICQGPELLNGPANTALPVVIAADVNCDLSNLSDSKYPTCALLLNAGFVDAWIAANPSESGYTKDLPVMTMRGDYVMVRGRFGVQAAVLVGEEPGDKTQSGLWASNHCGVVARLQHPEQQ
jgi:hypothetical protein